MKANWIMIAAIALAAVLAVTMLSPSRTVSCQREESRFGPSSGTVQCRPLLARMLSMFQ